MRGKRQVIGLMACNKREHPPANDKKECEPEEDPPLPSIDNSGDNIEVYLYPNSPQIPNEQITRVETENTNLVQPTHYEDVRDQVFFSEHPRRRAIVVDESNSSC